MDLCLLWHMLYYVVRLYNGCCCAAAAAAAMCRDCRRSRDDFLNIDELCKMTNNCELVKAKVDIVEIYFSFLIQLTALRRGQFDGCICEGCQCRFHIRAVRCSAEQFGDRLGGLSGGSGDSDGCRLFLIAAQLGGRYVTQLFDMQYKAILVLCDDNVVALQQAIIQFEFIGCTFRLLRFVLLGCYEGHVRVGMEGRERKRGSVAAKK